MLKFTLMPENTKYTLLSSRLCRHLPTVALLILKIKVKKTKTKTKLKQSLNLSLFS